MTLNGDADTTWPWTEPVRYPKGEGPDYRYKRMNSKNLDVYDVSKLDQWDMMFTHTDTLDGLVNEGYCLASPGKVYVVYNQTSGGLTLDLSEVAGDFKVLWYDPAQGGELRTGSTEMVAGGRKVELGSAPTASGECVALVTLKYGF